MSTGTAPNLKRSHLTMMTMSFHGWVHCVSLLFVHSSNKGNIRDLFLQSVFFLYYIYCIYIAHTVRTFSLEPLCGPQFKKLWFRLCCVVISQLKESKRAVNSILVDDDEDEEDDVERVSWSGEPVGSMQSFPYSLSYGLYHLSFIWMLITFCLCVGISWSVKETASSIRSGSEQSFPKIDTTPSLARQGSGYSLSSLFKGNL